MDDDEPLFSAEDVKAIESLKYNPSLEPGYELLRGGLQWADEIPENISLEGLKTLCILLSARVFLHRGLTLSDYPFEPEQCKNIWERAQRQVKWPGFNRLVLSEKDKAYLEEEENAEF